MDAKLICILGTTATGKTQLAAQLAALIGGEIISADSRQVYRGMDIGSGKDLNEFVVNGQNIPFHLIDVVDPGYEYNVFEFQNDFFEAYNQIIEKEQIPILCGGTGMYIESVLKGYQLVKVPRDEALRVRLDKKSEVELQEMLRQTRMPHNTTDSTDRERMFRAIEIDSYYQEHPDLIRKTPKINAINFGMRYERNEIRDRITNRLEHRLQNGLLEEVQQLINSGISPDILKFYGLEYRFITQYLLEEISYNSMFQELNTAIHQFAKRQETWWRKMEKQGTRILWIDGNLSIDEKITFVLSHLK
jgi:tRNA dimethylallyltransferase